MVLDTSAILAILQDEPERRAFNEAIEAAEERLLSVVSFVEASMVLESRYGTAGIAALDRLIGRASVDLVAVDAAQGHRAREAFSRYGKGRHPAGLNLGDCFSYALASLRGQPLLFKGQDFSQTEIESALHEGSA